MVTKKNSRAETDAQEIVHCRATNIGVSGFAECQRVGPNNCAYALPFGYAFLCHHPRMGEIIANTERQKPELVEAN